MPRYRRLLCTWALAISLPAFATHAMEPSDGPSTPTLDRADRALRTAELASDEQYKLSAYERAEALAVEALTENPDSAHANFLLFAARGRRLLITRGKSGLVFQFSKLNGYLERAIELDPTHHKALAVRGGILLDLPRFLGGSVTKARADLIRALELNPKGAGTHVTLAEIMIEQGDLDAARASARMGAHYACVTRRAHILRKAIKMLDELGPDEASAR